MSAAMKRFAIPFVALLALTSCGGGSRSTHSLLSPSSPASITAIAIAPSSPSVNVGSSVQLMATATYSDGTTADVTNSVGWSVVVPQVASLVSPGLFKGVSAGSSQIDAVADQNVAASTTLTVVLPVSSIEVSPSNATISAGDSLQYMAIATLTDDTNVDITNSVTWSLSNSAIPAAGYTIPNGNGLLITQTGIVTMPTTTDVVATFNGVSGKATLTITP